MLVDKFLFFFVFFFNEEKFFSALIACSKWACAIGSSFSVLKGYI